VGGLEVEYGPHLNQSDRISIQHSDQFSDEYGQKFDELVRAFELFATGKEYFKTLYYNQEISQLSRVLLVISLPTILVVASSTLAIEAHLLPDFWLFDCPPPDVRFARDHRRVGPVRHADRVHAPDRDRRGNEPPPPARSQ